MGEAWAADQVSRLFEPAPVEESTIPASNEEENDEEAEAEPTSEEENSNEDEEEEDEEAAIAEYMSVKAAFARVDVGDEVPVFSGGVEEERSQEETSEEAEAEIPTEEQRAI